MVEETMRIKIKIKIKRITTTVSPNGSTRKHCVGKNDTAMVALRAT